MGPGTAAADRGAARGEVARRGKIAGDRLRTLVRRGGPVPWSTLVQVALYGPAGFYTLGGGAGLRRDFLTSVEVGPLFGEVVARAVDAAWQDCGRPDEWFVVEVGAGSGALAAGVLAARPACSSALRYVAVERSRALRSVARARLPYAAPSEASGPRRGTSRSGPMLMVTTEIPAGRISGVVLANELVDNLAFDVYQREEAGWVEVRVGVEAHRLIEVMVPASTRVGACLDMLAPDAEAGARVPWQGEGQAWVATALATVTRGRVIVVDYMRTTAEMAVLGAAPWLRTHRRGGAGRAALESLGSQDITADVAVDQLGLARRPTRIVDQASWLAGHGIGELSGAAAARWRERASIGDLEALRSRSRGIEAAALLDRFGLGSFTVCEWDVG